MRVSGLRDTGAASGKFPMRPVALKIERYNRFDAARLRDAEPFKSAVFTLGVRAHHIVALEKPDLIECNRGTGEELHQ